MSSIVERQAGTCPVCEHEQKVYDDGTMVHHGYRRPGFGAIVGDCYGVGEPAYELSDVGCKRHVVRLQRFIESRTKELDYWRTTTDTITVPSRIDGRPRQVAPDHPGYERLRQEHIAALEASIKEMRFEQTLMNKRIERWQPRPLITVKELAERDRRTVDQKRAARSAVLEAARDKAMANHAKNFKRVEKLLPKLTDSALADLAKLRPPDFSMGFSAKRLGARSALDSVTKSIELASAPPGDFSTKTEWQEWGSLPAKAAETIKDSLEYLGHYRSGNRNYVLT